MIEKYRAEYNLLLAVRENSSLMQNDYLKMVVISSISLRIKDALDVCYRKSISDNFMSDYYENRQNIVYEYDDDDDYQLELYDESADWDLNHHGEVIEEFESKLIGIFSSIFDLYYIKLLIDDDFYFFDRLIEVGEVSDLDLLAAALSGLRRDHFSDEEFDDSMELWSDVSDTHPDDLVYIDAYKEFRTNLSLINNYLVLKPLFVYMSEGVKLNLEYMVKRNFEKVRVKFYKSKDFRNNFRSSSSEESDNEIPF